MTLTEQSDGTVVSIDEVRDSTRQQVRELSAQGFRTLGLACRDMGAVDRVSKEHETAMTFLGLVAFADPPKPGMAETIGGGVCRAGGWAGESAPAYGN